MRGFDVTDRTVMMAIIAAYTAGALIVLSVLISTAVWPSVSQAF